MNTEQEIRLCNIVYVALLLFTGISVLVAHTLSLSRASAVLVALGIAWFKAGLIAYHFMRLKSERPLAWIILSVAVVSVLILAIGVGPDLGVYTR